MVFEGKLAAFGVDGKIGEGVVVRGLQQVESVFGAGCRVVN